MGGRPPIFYTQNITVYIINLLVWLVYMASRDDKKLARQIKRAINADVNNTGATLDLYQLALSLGRGDTFARDLIQYLSDLIPKRLRLKTMSKVGLIEYYEQLGDCLLFASHYNVDAYFQRLEWKRDPEKKFYIPRRKQLRPMIQGFQDILDDKIDVLTVSLPPGTGKSGGGEFFLSMVAGIWWDKFNMAITYSDDIQQMFYRDVLHIIEDREEYSWYEIFPDRTIQDKSAGRSEIDIRQKGAFSTLQFRSINGGLTGRTRCSGLMYSDDLVKKQEEAMNKNLMDKLWDEYNASGKSRVLEGYKEVLVGTRWSVHDPIGRTVRANVDNPRFREVVIPALDENDESNFDYPYSLGFSTKTYHSLRNSMEDSIWSSLYMNEPYERDGLLYTSTELRRFYELPVGADGKTLEPDAIISICDTKDTGKDYAFLPVVYVYGEDYYLYDCVCDNSLPEHVEGKIVNTLHRHNVHACRFESNSAGGRIADKVQSELRKLGGKTHITKKFTTANKETKIIVHAHWVKERVLFLDRKYANAEYKKMLDLLTSYTLTGRQQLDDVPDGMAMLSDFAQSFTNRTFKVINNPLHYM